MSIKSRIRGFASRVGNAAGMPFSRKISFVVHNIIVIVYSVVLAGVMAFCLKTNVADYSSGFWCVLVSLCCAQGVAAAFEKNRRELRNYIVMDVLLAIVPLTAAFVLLYRMRTIKVLVFKKLRVLMLKNPGDMDVIQMEYRCCGIYSPADYKGNVPDSCSEFRDGCAGAMAAYHMMLTRVAVGLYAVWFLLLTIGFVLAVHFRASMPEEPTKNKATNTRT